MGVGKNKGFVDDSLRKRSARKRGAENCQPKNTTRYQNALVNLLQGDYLMFPFIRSISSATRLVMLALIILVLPFSGLAQPDAAKQQPSPEPAKPEASRRRDQPAEDESRPRDPMSTPTLIGCSIRPCGP